MGDEEQRHEAAQERREAAAEQQPGDAKDAEFDPAAAAARSGTAEGEDPPNSPVKGETGGLEEGDVTRADQLDDRVQEGEGLPE